MSLDKTEAKRSSNIIKINYNNKTPIKRPSWDIYFLNIAKAVALRSHDMQTQVGVVIVGDNQRILSTGYNGFPSKCNDGDLPNLRPDKYPFIVHGEINAIVACRQDMRGSTLYSTHSPCRECAKAIITTGIKNVVFDTHYQNEDTEFVSQFLSSCNVNLKLCTP